MKVLLIVARAYLFWSGFIYLFGQVFFASFYLSSTVAAIAAFTAGSFGGIHGPKAHWKRRVTWVACGVGASAVGFEAFDYYTTPHAVGNYYAWHGAALFVLSFLFVAVSTFLQLGKVGVRHEPAA